MNYTQLEPQCNGWRRCWGFGCPRNDSNSIFLYPQETAHTRMEDNRTGPRVQPNCIQLGQCGWRKFSLRTSFPQRPHDSVDEETHSKSRSSCHLNSGTKCNVSS